MTSLPPPDRLTQIQDCLDKLSEMMYISIGVIQRDAPLVALSSDRKVTAWTEEQIKANTASTAALAADAATDIVRTCKVIDFLVDRLPGVNQSVHDQVENLKSLESKSDIAGSKMNECILKAEAKLAKIREVLKRIADDQFDGFASFLAECDDYNKSEK